MNTLHHCMQSVQYDEQLISTMDNFNYDSFILVQNIDHFYLTIKPLSNHFQFVIMKKYQKDVAFTFYSLLCFVEF